MNNSCVVCRVRTRARARARAWNSADSNFLLARGCGSFPSSFLYYNIVLN